MPAILFRKSIRSQSGILFLLVYLLSTFQSGKAHAQMWGAGFYGAGFGQTCPYELQIGSGAVDISDDIDETNSQIRELRSRRSEVRSKQRELESDIREARRTIERVGIQKRYLDELELHISNGYTCSSYRAHSSNQCPAESVPATPQENNGTGGADGQQQQGNSRQGFQFFNMASWFGESSSEGVSVSRGPASVRAPASGSTDVVVPGRSPAQTTGASTPQVAPPPPTLQSADAQPNATTQAEASAAAAGQGNTTTTTTTTTLPAEPRPAPPAQGSPSGSNTGPSQVSCVQRGTVDLSNYPANVFLGVGSAPICQDRPGQIHVAIACNYQDSQPSNRASYNQATCMRNLERFQRLTLEKKSVADELAAIDTQIADLQDQKRDLTRERRELVREEQREARRQMTEGGSPDAMLMNGSVFRPRRPSTGELIFNFATGIGLGYMGYQMQNQQNRINGDLGFPGQSPWLGASAGFPYMLNGVYGAIGAATGRGGFGCVNGAGGLFGPGGVGGFPGGYYPGRYRHSLINS